MAKRGRGTRTKAEARAMKVAVFVDHYIANGYNGVQAYRAAGYRAKNTNVAAVEASRLLRKPNVAKLVEQARAEALERSKLTRDEALQSLARDVRFDPANVVDDDGKLIPLKQMDKDTRLALRGVEVFQEFQGKGEDREYIGDTVKVKFPEKTAAREQAMKHFGLYELDNKQKPPLQVAVGILTVRPGEDHFAKVRARALKAPA